MTQITTNSSSEIAPYLKQIQQPNQFSHKGQNGKVLVVGGSSLFHAAVIWSAEAVAHIVDMVHVASTDDNNAIIRHIKQQWHKGMVVDQKDIVHYAQEDNVILVGNGMMRGEAKSQKPKAKSNTWEEILDIKNEGEVTKEIVYYLISHFPDKQFVFDAGALQMMQAEWLPLLHTKAVVTPHLKEFQTLFGVDLHILTFEEKEMIVAQKAKQYSCIILLKSIEDIVTDGVITVRIKGGNAGLTKGGTGDVLAGLVAGMSASSDAFPSAVMGSYLIKKTAEYVAQSKGYWYTADDILAAFSTVFHSLTLPAI